MNICFVSQEYPPETGWGGIGSYVYEMANALTGLGHKVVVLSRGHKEDSFVTQNNIDIYRVYPGPGFSESMILWRFQRYWDGYRRTVSNKLGILNSKYNFDIIETTDIYADLLWYVNFSRTATPIVIKLHTPRWLVDILCENKKGLWNRLQYMAEWQSLLRADSVYSCSLALLDRCKIFLPKREYKVVYNPIIVNSGLENIDTTPLHQEVLFVGRLEWRKGVQIFPAVISSVCARSISTTFTLVGPDQPWPGGASMMDYLWAELPKQYEKNLVFTGAISREEVLKFLEKRPICVFPSLWENFPYTCLEAMSYGCAVIGSKHGGMSEMIIDGESGLLVDPDNPEEISMAVIQLLEDTTLRKKIGMNAARRVRDNFSSVKIAQKTLDVYNDAIMSSANK